MGVLVEALNVIVPCPVLEGKYVGGVRAYAGDCPNRTFCCDGHLTRVGFCAPADVAAFVNRLKARGLVLVDGEQFRELAIVDEYRGPTAPCPWLEGGRHEAGFSVVWLKGVSPTPAVAPPGWQLGQSAKWGFVSTRNTSARLLPLAKGASIDVVLHYASGREVYSPRTREFDPR